MSFPDAALSLTDAASRGDLIAAWDSAVRLLPWLSDLRNQIDARSFHTLLWTGAINNRWFDIAELLAAAVAARADAPISIRRIHAQMLVERGYTEEALTRLHALLKHADLSDYDKRETFGHIGRINKDRFITAIRAGDEAAARGSLKQAIEAYLTLYTTDPGLVWHGINAVALLARPEAAAIDQDANTRARQIATEILQEVQRQSPNAYTSATMAEAHVALGEYAQALEFIVAYISNPSVSGFMLGSLLRQLTQIWELDRRSSPGPASVALVSAALLEREGGVLQLSGADVRRARKVTRADYEAVFGTDRFDSFENYRRGLERCSCVARIGRTRDVGIGTGFVVPGRALAPRLGDPFVLLTNSHVISEDESERDKGALHPDEAVVTFAALEGVSPDREFAVARILFSSPPQQLDVTVVELSEPVSPSLAYPLAPVLPTRGSDARVRIIGHPSGRGLSLSANTLLDYELPKLHYRAATEGGSSGSPVFNQDWKLIGLHHAGGETVPKLNGQAGTYQANEGIWIKSICEALDKARSTASG